MPWATEDVEEQIPGRGQTVGCEAWEPARVCGFPDSPHLSNMEDRFELRPWQDDLPAFMTLSKLLHFPQIFILGIGSCE